MNPKKTSTQIKLEELIILIKWFEKYIKGNNGE